MKSRHRRQAFTLIELLVVVAIIVVLIAILMPSLSKARRQAKAVQCASNMRSLATLCLMYSDESNGQIIRANNGTIAGMTGTIDWLELLSARGYLRSKHDYDLMTVCPVVIEQRSGQEKTYILNWFTSGDTTGTGRWMRLSEFPNTTGTFFFADMMYPASGFSTLNTVNKDSAVERLGIRHGEGYSFFNVAFLDGHVEPRKHPLPLLIWADTRYRD